MNNDAQQALLNFMDTQAIKDAMLVLRNAHELHLRDAYDALSDELEKRIDADDFADFIDSITFC